MDDVTTLYFLFQILITGGNLEDSTNALEFAKQNGINISSYNSMKMSSDDMHSVWIMNVSVA